MPHIPLIFIIAGEPSGDQLGAGLMASLKELREVRFAGIGGSAMAAQGLTTLFPMEDLSIMGVGGILRQLPHLLRRLKDTVETIQRIKPDVVVTIDAPEFSFRVLKRLHKLPSRPPLVHYVAPTVWAWRPGRAQKISRFVDRLLCLYPFELPYFEKHGLKTVFVGHPVAKEINKKTVIASPPIKGGHSNPVNEFLLDRDALLEGGLAMTSEEESRSTCNDGIYVDRNRNLLCLLPGSRRSEIETLMPIFGQTVTLMQKEIPNLKVILPTIPSMKDLVEEKAQGWPMNVQIVVGEDARDQAFQQASVALAASGTVALQLAAAGLPFVIAYKVNKLNEWIGRALLKTPWACMVNILLAFHTFGPDFVLNRKAKQKIKEPWIPEFLQENCTPENLKAALMKLFHEPKTRQHQEQAMHQAIALLKAPPQAAAQNVLEEMGTNGLI